MTMCGLLCAYRVITTFPPCNAFAVLFRHCILCFAFWPACEQTGAAYHYKTGRGVQRASCICTVCKCSEILQDKWHYVKVQCYLSSAWPRATDVAYLHMHHVSSPCLISTAGSMYRFAAWGHPGSLTPLPFCCTTGIHRTSFP